MNFWKVDVEKRKKMRLYDECLNRILQMNSKKKKKWLSLKNQRKTWIHIKMNFHWIYLLFLFSLNLYTVKPPNNGKILSAHWDFGIGWLCCLHFIFISITLEMNIKMKLFTWFFFHSKFKCLHVTSWIVRTIFLVKINWYIRTS